MYVCNNIIIIEAREHLLKHGTGIKDIEYVCTCFARKPILFISFSWEPGEAPQNNPKKRANLGKRNGGRS